MKAFSALLFLFSSMIIFAQTKISGRITLGNGKPGAEISITIKDSYDGATTDKDGNYSFETTEAGEKILIFSGAKIAETERKITISNEPIILNLNLKPAVNEIEAVVISAGTIEASDKKRATAQLTPMDVYNTAGANGQISAGVKFFPGVQNSGDSEGLSIRGGATSETQFFIDGNLVNSFYTASLPGIPGGDRFNTNIFKGSVFSSGGYSALYGQALSGIFALQSIDFPEKSSFGATIMPFMLKSDFQKVNTKKDFSYGAEASYFNIGFINKLLKTKTDFIKNPESFGANANFRWKTKSGGMLKYYGSFDANSVAISQNSLESNYDEQQPEIKGKNTYQSLNFRQKIGKYTLNSGASFTANSQNLKVEIFNDNQKVAEVVQDKNSLYFNQKTVLERKIKSNGTLKSGYEFQFSEADYHNEIPFSGTLNFKVKNLNSALFSEINYAFTNDFSVSGGLRAEHSTAIGKWNLAPRLAAAYRLSEKWTGSFAYGIFYQNPENQFLAKPSPDFQKAAHYIFLLERSENRRTLRTEVFYKKYSQLSKYQQNTATGIVPENIFGEGFAKGFEVLWNDKKTFKNFDYRLSYSYLDARRNDKNYPEMLAPSYSSRHNFAAVVSHFREAWKTGFSLSYRYSSPRNYYAVSTNSGQNKLEYTLATKPYNSLEFSMYYIPNLGSKEAKSFSILVAGINNITGFKNTLGYRFSQDALRSEPMLPTNNTMFYVGLILNFGTDKTQETVDKLK